MKDMRQWAGFLFSTLHIGLASAASAVSDMFLGQENAEPSCQLLNVTSRVCPVNDTKEIVLYEQACQAAWNTSSQTLIAKCMECFGCCLETATQAVGNLYETLQNYPRSFQTVVINNLTEAMNYTQCDAKPQSHSGLYKAFGVLLFGVSGLCIVASLHKFFQGRMYENLFKRNRLEQAEAKSNEFYRDGFAAWFVGNAFIALAAGVVSRNPVVGVGVVCGLMGFNGVALVLKGMTSEPRPDPQDYQLQEEEPPEDQDLDAARRGGAVPGVS